MQLGLNALFQFLDTCNTSHLVLATVIRTQGASYRKAGAMMLIDGDLNTSGLVSGGCLEDDLVAHARSVFDTGLPKTVTYDLSDEESASLWGLGLGCGGVIDIFLERIHDDNQFGGLASVRSAYFEGTPVWLHKCVASKAEDRVGRFGTEIGKLRDWHAKMRAAIKTIDGDSTLSIPISPVNRLLVCGAGPDAIPLVKLAHQVGWQVIVSDPRPAYLNATHFASASERIIDTPENVDVARLGALRAAVIMTHNVERDIQWLKRLHALPVPYLGLLGPAARRDMLLERAGLAHEDRLHGPVGLDIGASLPEEIALSIVAHMHAALAEAPGTPLA